MKLNYTSEICVFFLTTIYEFENGELETAIDYYLTELKKATANIHLICLYFLINHIVDETLSI